MRGMCWVPPSSPPGLQPQNLTEASGSAGDVTTVGLMTRPPTPQAHLCKGIMIHLYS